MDYERPDLRRVTWVGNSKTKLKGRYIVSITTKEWVLDTVAKLPNPEMGELKQYLEYLIWKSQRPKGKGQPTQVLEAINKSHDVTMEDALALLESIKEGKTPIRFDPPFDEIVR